MVNRAGNEKAQELYLLSSFSPCSGARSQQAPCVPSVAFLSRRRGAHIHRDHRPRQILGPLPREMHTHACQTAPADCLSSGNTVTVLICNYVYLFFSFVNLDRSYYHNHFQMVPPGSQPLSPSSFSFATVNKTQVLP